MVGASASEVRWQFGLCIRLRNHHNSSINLEPHDFFLGLVRCGGMYEIVGGFGFGENLGYFWVRILELGIEIVCDGV